MIDVFLHLYINLHFVRLHIKKSLSHFQFYAKGKKKWILLGQNSVQMMSFYRYAFFLFQSNKHNHFFLLNIQLVCRIQVQNIEFPYCLIYKFRMS